MKPKSMTAGLAIVLPGILLGAYFGAYFYLFKRIPWMDLRPERQITVEVNQAWQVKFFKPAAALEAWATGLTVQVYRTNPRFIEPF